MTDFAMHVVNEEDTRVRMSEHITGEEFRHQLGGLLGRGGHKVDSSGEDHREGQKGGWVRSGRGWPTEQSADLALAR